MMLNDLKRSPVWALFQNWQQIRRLPSVRMALLWLLFSSFIFVIYLSLSSGAVDVERTTIRAVILDEISDSLSLGYDSGLDYDNRLINRDATLISQIRLPRVILTGLVGAALALAGAALQGVFRNPLADPGLIGVGSGGAIGAVTAIIMNWSIPLLDNGERLAEVLCGFLGALIMTFFVYRLAYRHERTDSTNLLLIGLAINAITASYVGLATFASTERSAGDITFWTLGSAANAFWRDVYIMLPFVIIAGLGLPRLAQQLNLMALGETEARHLGVDVDRLRALTMILSAMMVGAGVALIGIVGFVGLVVPHFNRMAFGPDHRILLPTSMIGGATFVMAADLFARLIVEPSEIPLGVITTLVGGPFFLFLILIYRRRGILA